MTNIPYLGEPTSVLGKGGGGSISHPVPPCPPLERQFAKGHEATDTGLAYAPVSQEHGHHHTQFAKGGGGFQGECKGIVLSPRCYRAHSLDVRRVCIPKFMVLLSQGLVHMPSPLHEKGPIHHTT